MRGRAVSVSPRWWLLALALAPPLMAQQLAINDDHPIFADAFPLAIRGTAAPESTVTVQVENGLPMTTRADAIGGWSVIISAPLSTGTYTVTARGRGATTTQLLRVQLPGPLQRQSGIAPPEPRYAEMDRLVTDAAVVMTDRWRIAPPPYELDEFPAARPIGHRGVTLDPYNRNLIKGDLPIRGDDTFLVITAISDTLSESRTLPTPTGVSTVRSGSIRFFGRDDQNLFNQNLDLSVDLFQGDTAFMPIRQRVKATVIANLNYLHVEENGLVKPDVRRGTRRTDGELALQEVFYERKLRDLTPNFDFLSFRAGSQPFTSDFRGFIYSDTNAGVRLFGNGAANRFQYNLAFFDRLEKDTNSGLNIWHERRGQQVGVANLYWQDFLVKGYTQQFSLHLLHDGPSFKYDRNGVLVRPAPVGVFRPHSINAVYFGEAGLGHLGRFNVDQALYVVLGRDSLNPIAGPDPRFRDGDAVRIAAGMTAAEISYDHDWFRPRLAFFYATGDHHPRDRVARGFDSIYDSTAAFAGGGFSFFNRLGVPLAGTGLDLVERGSLLPSLRTSKDEGQPNFVNPGLRLLSAGVDVDLTTRLKAIFTANAIALDATQTLEALLFQSKIHRQLGDDFSVGLRYRPLLTNNVIIAGGLAAFLPGRGFRDIYESGNTLYHIFTNLILTF